MTTQPATVTGPQVRRPLGTSCTVIAHHAGSQTGSQPASFAALNHKMCTYTQPACCCCCSQTDRHTYKSKYRQHSTSPMRWVDLTQPSHKQLARGPGNTKGSCGLSYELDTRYIRHISRSTGKLDTRLVSQGDIVNCARVCKRARNPDLCLYDFGDNSVSACYLLSQIKDV